MNDNFDKARGAEVHLIAYFRPDRKLFEFYSCLPNFITNHVHDRRINRGQGLLLLIQIAGKESFLHLTEYCFHAHRR